MFIVAFGKELHKRGELIKELAFFFQTGTKGNMENPVGLKEITVSQLQQ